MLHNNNNEVIRRLSRKSLRENKMRNVFVVLGIMLTTLLLTATLTVGLTFYQTNDMYNITSTTGLNADGYIHVNPTQFEQLKNQSGIDEIVFSQLASEEPLKNIEFLGENVKLEAANNEVIYDMKGVVPIEGTYPKNLNEALVPTWVLDVLGLDYAVGGNITLDVDLNGTVTPMDLTITGYYESVTPKGAGRSSVFVTPEFVENYNPSIISVKKTGTAYINLSTLSKRSSMEEATASFETLAQAVGSDSFKAHPKFEADSNGQVIGQVIAVIGAVLLVIFSGYLIIYNIGGLKLQMQNLSKQ